eukprot:397438-Prorocentrum_minimum.AAC.2
MATMLETSGGDRPLTVLANASALRRGGSPQRGASARRAAPRSATSFALYVSCFFWFRNAAAWEQGGNRLLILRLVRELRICSLRLCD